jgi:dTDP-4-dehydrorhamnose reductase
MDERKKILVTGARGQLGSEIKTIADKYPAFEFLFTDRETLSVTDEAAILSYFQQHQPQYCINCAAYTAVDKAEDPAERSLVEALNSEAPGYLAKACTAYGAKLIHISTDYVFDGNGTVPYKEGDPTGPVSVYGITKLEGEKKALQYTDAIIIRTAWVYSTYGKNFVKTMIRLMQERPHINVVCDQYGTPTYAADLAEAIMQIIVSKKWRSGIYHYSNEGKISWYDFAVAIKDLIHADTEIKAIPTVAYPTPAKRPAWSVLDKTKIKETYNVPIPNWSNSLQACIQKLQ